nr:TOBE domain-containing protein [Dickeya oryzae]
MRREKAFDGYASSDLGVIIDSSWRGYVRARNQFSGTVNRIADGAVNATAHITTTNGLKLTASVTNDSVQEMGLYAGSAVIALVKASSVILATRV